MQEDGVRGDSLPIPRLRRPEWAGRDVYGVQVEEWEPTPVTAHTLEEAQLELNEKLDERDRELVGRWGERLAACALRTSGEFGSVRWVNEDHEQGLPYDIEAVRQTAGATVNASDSDVDAASRAPSQTVYLEVKTTTTLDKPLFEISCGELDFMRRTGIAFELCRVWAAGTPNVRVARLRDPAAALASGQLALLIGASDGRPGRASKRQRIE